MLQGLTSSEETDLKKPLTLALAIVVACSVWLFAEKREAAPGMYHQILEGEAFRGTLVNRKKSGELYWAEQTITPIRTESSSGGSARVTGHPEIMLPLGGSNPLRGTQPQSDAFDGLRFALRTH